MEDVKTQVTGISNIEKPQTVQLTVQEYQDLQVLAQRGLQQPSLLNELLKEVMQKPDGLKQLKETTKELIESGASCWGKLYGLPLH